MEQRIIDLPATGSHARFADGFAQRSLLTVDTEEEFDWNSPFQASGHGLDHVARLRKFQEFCEGLNVSPTYLIDWPVATSPLAIEIIGDAVDRGTAEVGVQLHPWVNPPYEEEVNNFNSFAGNLPVELERAKLLGLRDEIEKNFKTSPKIYRAGRYGLGPHTARLLKEANIPIDSSVRAKFDYSDGHGPNYEHHPLEPYWANSDHTLLELPLTTIFWGMLRKQGDALFPMLKRLPSVLGALSRLAMLERISLTPEGVSASEALRAIDIALDDGLPILILSFHSPSLVPGNTPYVQNDDDLDRLYDWWRQIYAYLDQRGIRPTTVKQILAASGLE